ncbi:MAG TPA: cysteine desulfurase family protein [Candidatus Saccharimonadales bacterium]|nr:cysteine desulfurase family protein [Candidatus Saccharimonadales bacterium]
MKKVYADYAASTPTDSEVIRAMLPYVNEKFANPASRHSAGQGVSLVVEAARQTIADFVGAKSEEVYFTGTGTESNNLAILGVAKANQNKGKHIVTTQIEHPSIINAARSLESAGWQVTYLPIDKNGQINLSDLEKSLTKKTILFSIHFGNSELGTMPDLKEISKICHRRGVLLHVDACQAMPYIPMDVEEMGIDLLTFNGSKLYGPKGVAVLFVRNGVSIFPLVYGGGQEKSLRSGTLNVLGIAGLAKACQIASENQVDMIYHITRLRDNLQNQLEKLPNIQINCKSAKRLPNHLSVTFEGVENRDLVRELDKMGVEVASGSACSSKELGGSYVLRALGLSPSEAQATLRITLGRSTATSDCQSIYRAIKCLI